MSQQALYRIWRPQDFGELTGQDPIRRTLENAILQERISHAYLFAGPRGTGKTSAARILAKALNCTDRQGAQPCGKCENCRSITRGNAMDVLEIDAASNRGIDEIRDLKEKIGFLPATGKYKVYIVDEAHMLTTEAFNALLKTLEEPPAHVVFILATTEPQKMPETVLSRCQRFDFKKLSRDAVWQRLQEILAGMNREAEPEALSLIIRQADGSLRDAIGLLDQCLSYTLGVLRMEEACEILGLVRQEALASLLTAVIAGEAGTLFDELESLFVQGLDPKQVLSEFAGYCRDLLLMALCGSDTELVVAAGDQRRRMVAQCGSLGPDGLQRILSLADQAAAGAGYRGNSAYMAEAFFAGLLLERADKGVQSVKSVRGSGSAEPSFSDAPRQIRRLTAEGETAPWITPEDRLPAMPAKETEEPVLPDQAPVRPKPGASELETGETAASEPAASDPAASEPEAGEPAANLPADCNPASAELPAQQWERILLAIKSQKIVLHAYLLASVRQERKEGKLILYFDPLKGDFHKNRSEEKENLEIIKEAASEILGCETDVECGFLGGGQEEDPVDKAIRLFGRNVVKLE